MATVTFENVNKIYGDFQAVKDLNLEIGDGEFMVLVGPSGCGKTTSLRMIAGLEEITSGTLRIGDRVVNDVPPKDRDIAMVFQSYALYPHMSVRENLAFGLKLRKVPKAEIERRVKETAETIQLEKLLDRKPKELSGGQRQRVALGRAIVREPAVFLMDEPLSNLDAKLRVQTRAEIARLHQRLKTTIVYVTHDQVEAMTMGSRIAVMNDGAAPAGRRRRRSLYDTPINRFVAGFIGSPSMNFARGPHGGLGRRAPGSSAAADWSIPLPSRYREAATPKAGKTLDRRVPAGAPRHRRGRHRAPARSGRAPTSSSTSATRSCSTSAPPTRTSSRSSTRSIASGPATSSTWSCRSSKLHLFDGETGLTLAPGRRGRQLSADRSSSDPTAPEDPSGADLVERVVDSQVLHRGRYLTFRIDTIERADGSRGDPRDRRPPGRGGDPGHRRRGSRAARPAVPGRGRRRLLLEIPAGTLDVADDGSVEDPDLAARRELEEETGMRAGSWRLLARFYTAPGFASELMHLYLATDLRPADGDRLGPDEDEHLLLERLPWRDAVAAAERGEIADAKSLVALLWLARDRERGLAARRRSRRASGASARRAGGSRPSAPRRAGRPG